MFQLPPAATLVSMGLRNCPSLAPSNACWPVLDSMWRWPSIAKALSWARGVSSPLNRTQRSA
eukprot:6479265-Amphidinium_carterae.1